MGQHLEQGVLGKVLGQLPYLVAVEISQVCSVSV